MKEIKELEKNLNRAILKSFGEEEKAGLLFSGGVDSSLLAFLCRKNRKKIKLYSVFYEKSYDKLQSITAAKSLGIEISTKEYTKKEIKELYHEFKEICRKLELSFPSQVILSVKFATFAAIKFAAEKENLLLSGQGADELFAGYAKYIKTLEEKSNEELEKAMKQDFENIDTETDEKIARYFGAEIKFPYLEKNIVDFAFSLPIYFKIRNRKRKFILYELAKELGISKEITEKDKKALQYSSGFDKILRKILKEEQKL